MIYPILRKSASQTGEWMCFRLASNIFLAFSTATFYVHSDGMGIRAIITKINIVQMNAKDFRLKRFSIITIHLKVIMRHSVIKIV